MNAEVKRLAGRLRGHHVWKGVNGQFYVWRLKTSPQDLRRHDARAELLADLRHRVAEQERYDTDYQVGHEWMLPPRG